MKIKWIYPILFLGSFLQCLAMAQSPPGPAPVICPPMPPAREAAPSLLPHVKPVFEDVRYWIGRLSDPEKILLAAGEIEEVNRKALKSDPEAVDIFSLTDGMSAGPLQETLCRDRERYGKLKLYDLTNRVIPPDYFVRLFSRMDVERIPRSITPVYGIVSRETNLRVLPTDDLVMDRPFDYAFDRFQSEKLDCGTPVAILHYTHERDWCFVETGLTKGWVKPNDVAVGGKGEVMNFARARPLIVSSDSVPFYRDREFRQFAFDLPMGARLPLVGRDGDAYKVLLPWRSLTGTLEVVDGFVKAKDHVHEGYLPYTPASVLRQAFKLKDSRYSWGGFGEGRDCSRFIMEIFRCFGFNMPRDSYRQAVFYRDRREEAGGWPEIQKMELLRRYEQTPTILYMRGHVMLFLGVVDDKAYAIHSYWEYSEDERPGLVFHVGRVVVSDLSLGKSGEGTLLKWTTTVIPMN